MKIETSSGGVVIFGNAILLLRKYNGDWVLPKGRVEPGEHLEKAGLREVYEEAGVRAELIRYLDKIEYEYRNIKREETICKTVHFYLMKSNTLNCKPQKNEGFVDAKFVHINKALSIIKYEDEKKILKKGLVLMGLKPQR